jgi:hypothetical protein
MHGEDNENIKKWLPTLDIGSHINAKHEPRPEPGARYERTLLGVGLQSTRGSLPASLFQNRACRFPGTRLLSDMSLVTSTLAGL